MKQTVSEPAIILNQDKSFLYKICSQLITKCLIIDITSE